MKLIVGLGNPGKTYHGSRHNAGFAVVDELACRCKIKLKKSFGTYALSGKATLKGCDIVLAQPLTFMNLSGIAVAALMKKYKVSVQNLLVVYDDLDLEAGRIKIKHSGSSAGHNGLQSVIGVLKTDAFARIRIGIGRPQDESDTVRYVLSRFSGHERKTMEEALQRACECVLAWADEGIDKTMNMFNKRHPNI